MRVYVAIPCPEELLPVARELQAQLGVIPGAHVLDEETLHITVIPPWEEPNPDAAVRDLAAIDCTEFGIAFTQAGYGHDASDPDLAWMLGDSSPELERLHMQAWRAIKSHDPPSAPFPHVTLARFEKGVALPELVQPDVVGQVTRIALYESMPGRKYRIVGERFLD